MHLAVFGATGGTGKEITAQALDAGHTVTAVVRDPARLPIEHDRLSTVEMDSFTADALVPVLADADAVLSGLGASARAGSPATAWARAVVAAMEKTGERRIVAVSAAPLGGPVPGDPLLHRLVVHPLIGRIFADVYRDLRTMERTLRDSGAPWTAVRPPRLTDRPKTGTYRSVVGANPPGGATISRADLAHAVLEVLERPETERGPLGVAY
ncbi:SDR family oxidoreductase [Nocardiopsis sp. RSe5-2]|uniref:SDR family oxidoreductase n=1 Tax=Nocardiopsis endophytica TaxID=3018445 RepID=A0ABT4U6V1_9ACTN|nr:SDR family oxidoreductase [Nocardiopsis endophytica]MDA2812194.1 SDR family oxidoreductase [Nocardiopsis endophytica]